MHPTPHRIVAFLTVLTVVPVRVNTVTHVFVAAHPNDLESRNDRSYVPARCLIPAAPSYPISSPSDGPRLDVTRRSHCAVYDGAQTLILFLH